MGLTGSPFGFLDGGGVPNHKGGIDFLIRAPHPNVMLSTRKMPVRINEKRQTTISGEHLIPQLSISPESGFVSVKSGKSYPCGAVVYLGKDVTSEMMLERYCQVAAPPEDRDAALRRLEAYCEALQSVKIGNVLLVSYSPNGMPLLKVAQEYFLRKPETKLP